MEGYAKLASLMGANPEVAILRRFGAMNAQNLLYFQAELVALEDDLRYYADQDSASDDLDRKLYSECWDYLSKSDDKSSGSDERAGQQWRTMLRIREKLKEYSSSKPIQRIYCFSISNFGSSTETSQTKRFCTRRRSQVFRSPTPEISPFSSNGWNLSQWAMCVWWAKTVMSGQSRINQTSSLYKLGTPTILLRPG